MSNNRQGDYAIDIDARLQARELARPMVAECALCDWRLEGTAGEVIAAQIEHRLRAHRIKGTRRASTKHLGSFRQPHLTDEDRDAIETEIARRRRLHGLDEVVPA